MYLPIPEQLTGIQNFAYASPYSKAHTPTLSETDKLSPILQHMYANTQYCFHLIEKEWGTEK